MNGVPALAVSLPPSRDAVRYAQAAEQLGYERVFVYDSPAFYGDLWITVGRIAEATSIGVGAGVAVPSLRHPMVTASAIATVEDIACGRLVTVFGTGYTARRGMGQLPMRWADLARYISQVRQLLEGRIVEIDGRPCQMLHSEGWGPARPIGNEIWVAPSGPKGLATARDLQTAGVLLTSTSKDVLSQKLDAVGRPARAAMVVHGTVLRPGEDNTTERVIEAAGPLYATAAFHTTWDRSPEMLESMPGGPQWRDEMLRARPEAERHLAVHEGHLTLLTERDRVGLKAAGSAMLDYGWTGYPDSIASRVEDVVTAGVNCLVYAPAGPDIPAELAAFAAATKGISL